MPNGRFILGLGLIVGVAGAIFHVSRDCFADCRSIAALEVTEPQAGKVVGKFMMTAPAKLGGGIATDRLGGGCVIFRTLQTKACATDADCVMPKRLDFPKTDVSTPPAAYTYCAPAGSCWVKIGEDFCWKSKATPSSVPVELKLNTPQHTKVGDMLAVRDALFGGGAAPQKIEARVVACLNGIAKGRPPCANGDGRKVEHFGKIYRVNLPAAPPAPPPLCPTAGMTPRPAAC